MGSLSPPMFLLGALGALWRGVWGRLRLHLKTACDVFIDPKALERIPASLLLPFLLPPKYWNGSPGRFFSHHQSRLSISTSYR